MNLSTLLAAIPSVPNASDWAGLLAVVLVVALGLWLERVDKRERALRGSGRAPPRATACCPATSARRAQGTGRSWALHSYCANLARHRWMAEFARPGRWKISLQLRW